VLTNYIDNYYNVSRTHMSLNKDSPVPRPVQPHGAVTDSRTPTVCADIEKL